MVSDHPVCTCRPFCLGWPPNCRPECIVSAECPQDLACIRNRCQNPCLGTCGLDARCQVVAHNPVCSCPDGYDGDPFLFCKPAAPSKTCFYSRRKSFGIHARAFTELKKALEDITRRREFAESYPAQIRVFGGNRLTFFKFNRSRSFFFFLILL